MDCNVDNLVEMFDQLIKHADQEIESANEKVKDANKLLEGAEKRYRNKKSGDVLCVVSNKDGDVAVCYDNKKKFEKSFRKIVIKSKEISKDFCVIKEIENELFLADGLKEKDFEDKIDQDSLFEKLGFVGNKRKPKTDRTALERRRKQKENLRKIDTYSEFYTNIDRNYKNKVIYFAKDRKMIICGNVTDEFKKVDKKDISKYKAYSSGRVIEEKEVTSYFEIDEKIKKGFENYREINIETETICNKLGLDPDDNVAEVVHKIICNEDKYACVLTSGEVYYIDKDMKGFSDEEVIEAKNYEELYNDFLKLSAGLVSYEDKVKLCSILGIHLNVDLLNRDNKVFRIKDGVKVEEKNFIRMSYELVSGETKVVFCLSNQKDDLASPEKINEFNKSKLEGYFDILNLAENVSSEFSKNGYGYAIDYCGILKAERIENGDKSVYIINNKYDDLGKLFGEWFDKKERMEYMSKQTLTQKEVKNYEGFYDTMYVEKKLTDYTIENKMCIELGLKRNLNSIKTIYMQKGMKLEKGNKFKKLFHGAALVVKGNIGPSISIEDIELKDKEQCKEEGKYDDLRIVNLATEKEGNIDIDFSKLAGKNSSNKIKHYSEISDEMKKKLKDTIKFVIRPKRIGLKKTINLKIIEVDVSLEDEENFARNFNLLQLGKTDGMCFLDSDSEENVKNEIIEEEKKKILETRFYRPEIYDMYITEKQIDYIISRYKKDRKIDLHYIITQNKIINANRLEEEKKKIDEEVKEENDSNDGTGDTGEVAKEMKLDKAKAEKSKEEQQEANNENNGEGNGTSLNGKASDTEEEVKGEEGKSEEQENSSEQRKDTVEEASGEEKSETGEKGNIAEKEESKECEQQEGMDKEESKDKGEQGEAEAEEAKEEEKKEEVKGKNGSNDGTSGTGEVAEEVKSDKAEAEKSKEEQQEGKPEEQENSSEQRKAEAEEAKEEEKREEVKGKNDSNDGTDDTEKVAEEMKPDGVEAEEIKAEDRREAEEGGKENQNEANNENNSEGDGAPLNDKASGTEESEESEQGVDKAEEVKEEEKSATSKEEDLDKNINPEGKEAVDKLVEIADSLKQNQESE